MDEHWSLPNRPGSWCSPWIDSNLEPWFFLGITQSKASRHLRYLYHLGLVSDRREGLWMYYSLCVAPDSHGDKLLRVLEEMLEPLPEAKALRERLDQWLEDKKSIQDKAALSREVACACT